MADKHYFGNFKQIFYKDYKCLNIMERAAFLESVYSNPFVYYPYDLTDGDRADTIAGDYYDDPFSSWLVYMGNKIIDPYYQWFLGEDDFNKFIVNKYGSIAKSQLYTAFYRVDWADDDQEISPSYYEDILADEVRKYWEATFAPNGRVVSYHRAQQDFTMNTNMILKIDITLSGNKKFSEGELARIRLGSANVGSVEVTKANTTAVYVRHVNVENEDFPLVADTFVDVTPGDSFRLLGYESAANAAISTYSIQQRNISSVETTYWSPVSFYDVENERNNQNKSIVLLDSIYRDKAITELSDRMKE